MMQSDVKAKNLTATAAAGIGPARIRGIWFVCGAAAGSISIKNGGASGTELIKIDTPAGATLGHYQLLPDKGVWFTQDPHVTMTNVTHLTFYYA